MKFVNTTAELIEVGKLETACKKLADKNVTVEVKRTMEKGKTVFVCKVTGKPIGSVTEKGENPTHATRVAVNAFLDLLRKNKDTKATQKRGAQVKGKDVRNNATTAELETLADDDVRVR